MPTIQQDKPAADGTRLGEFAAVQPLSGVQRIDETLAVNGLGRGAYVRLEESKKPEGQA